MSNESPRMVYQMCLTVASPDRRGFIFGNEEDEREQGQSFVFTLPLNSATDDWRNYRYLFPGLIGEKYAEFEASPKGNALMVKVEGIIIMFSPVAPLPFVFAPFTKGAVLAPQPLEYLGKDKLVGRFKWFLPIYPVNIIEMEELYKDKKIVLVGLTPNFSPNAYSDSLMRSRE